MACGAYLVGTEEVSHRMWSSSEAEKSSTWRELNVEHSRLKGLIQGLPAVLLKSKAENTSKKYERGFNAWRKWASQFKEIVIFPASSVYVSLFLSR